MIMVTACPSEDPGVNTAAYTTWRMKMICRRGIPSTVTWGRADRGAVRVRTREHRWRPWWVVVGVLLTGCSNHYLIHPKTTPPELVAWSDAVERGELLVRIEAVRPRGEGPFPGVLVHPEAGHTAKEMRGILRSLAQAGYLAMAADYRREKNGRYRETLFAWRDPEDPVVALGVLRGHAMVDSRRVGAIGYSQGGVFSLLVAAESPEVKAVVAYYPVTDFEHWLYDPERRGVRKFVFKVIRGHFRRQSGTETEEEFREFLARASPLKQAERIRAPVLLIHGDRDTSAGVGESRRLENRLRELGRDVELIEIEGAGHVFNFKNAEKSRRAWQATLEWLDRHVMAEAMDGCDTGERQ